MTPTAASAISPDVPRPVGLTRPALFDTGVWTWVRDRRFGHLAGWFNEQVAHGLVLVCDLVILELVRLTPNERRSAEVAERLDALPALPLSAGTFARGRELQRALAASGGHRSVPPADLLLAATAEQTGTPLVHYDRDFDRIAAVSDLDARWFVPDGSLGPSEAP